MRAWFRGSNAPIRSARRLPALYRDDDLAQRWFAAMDAELAPVFASLDGFEGYLDPAYAPETS